MFSTRRLFTYIYVACFGLLVFGLYLEHYAGLEPCPLCIFQRMAYIAVGAVAFIAALFNPKKIFSIIFFAVIDLVALIGAIIAGRQVWLQHLPEDRVPECGPGLEYMLDVFPFMEALSMIFKGSGECAEVKWTFLGFSIAEWSLVMFIAIMIVCAVGIMKSVKQSDQLNYIKS